MAAREGTGHKELRGGLGALQAVGMGVEVGGPRAIRHRQQLCLPQPLAHVAAHVDLQHAALGGQLTRSHIPARPGFRRRVGKSAGVHHRRAQVVAAEQDDLLELVAFHRRCRRSRGRSCQAECQQQSNH
ncbi:hypothetical protein G6F40_014936 [Rhizopus arrhizus]|nr:hypothetical protein G6F40_014936 [Rhizopus arrhizus]